MAEIREDPGCLTLSEEMADQRDFTAGETISLDKSIKLPNSFSLGQWIAKTNYQNGWGSCTSNATSHGVQILAVKNNGTIPTTTNIITPNWKELWKDMGHDLNNLNDSGDYVEKAVSTARKNGIKTEEGGVAKFDGYCYGTWLKTDESIETIKRYLYNGNPVVWCMRGSSTTWTELSQGQLKTFVSASKRTGGHAIACVGWDEGGLRFVNSWKTNDGKGNKSRFYVTYSKLKECYDMFNWRYWVLFAKEQAKKDPEYLRKKANALASLTALKKVYPDATTQVKGLIENISSALRNQYPELNEELPINS